MFRGDTDVALRQRPQTTQVGFYVARREFLRLFTPFRGCGAHHRLSTEFPPCTDREGASPRQLNPLYEPARRPECAPAEWLRVPGSPRPAVFCPWSLCHR